MKNAFNAAAYLDSLHERSAKEIKALFTKSNQQRRRKLADALETEIVTFINENAATGRYDLMQQEAGMMALLGPAALGLSEREIREADTAYLNLSQLVDTIGKIKGEEVNPVIRITIEEFAKVDKNDRNLFAAQLKAMATITERVALEVMKQQPPASIGEEFLNLFRSEKPEEYAPRATGAKPADPLVDLFSAMGDIAGGLFGEIFGQQPPPRGPKR